MSEEVIYKLWELISDLRAENAALQEIIFRQQGLLEEKVIVPEAVGGHIGKIPWHLRKARLEAASRKTQEIKEPEENAS